MDPKFNLRAAYGKSTLHKALSKLPDFSVHEPPKLKTPATFAPGPVCIIGAGSAGLAVAITIVDACKKAGLTPPPIDILEATQNTGGRVYSYPFNDSNAAAHNYYDVGAMRLPNIPAMNSTFNMITYLNNLNPNSIVLQPYVYSDNEGREPLMYYGKPYTQQMITDAMKPFKVVIEPLVQKLENLPPGDTFEHEFGNLLNQGYDNYSTRAYLMHGPNMNWQYAATETAETFGTSTGLFDQAWMETICDYYDFDQAKSWQRVENADHTKGMQALTDTMEAHLNSEGLKVSTGNPVLKIVDKSGQIEVTSTAPPLGKTSNVNNYESVFNTTTMGCLERMDIQGLNLDPDILAGIRALSYDRATKVCIKFNSAWWTMLGTEQQPFQGGVSSSDLPVSNVVYPSWTDAGNNILMISYAWAQDADRMGSLIADYKGQTQTNPNDPLVVLCLKNLAQLWSSVPSAPTLEELNQMYLAHHAWAWVQDAYTAGAFALFGPGQFSNLYPLLQQPQCQAANAGFYMCGEATSAHHAWISGALDSAYMSVWQWAVKQGSTAVTDALKALGFGGGEGENPAEMDENLLKWSLRAGQKQKL